MESSCITLMNQIENAMENRFTFLLKELTAYDHEDYIWPNFKCLLGIPLK